MEISVLLPFISTQAEEISIIQYKLYVVYIE